MLEKIALVAGLGKAVRFPELLRVKDPEVTASELPCT
jgi:hypothetical protein